MCVQTSARLRPQLDRAAVALCLAEIDSVVSMLLYIKSAGSKDAERRYRVEAQKVLVSVLNLLQRFQPSAQERQQLREMLGSLRALSTNLD